MFFSLPLGITAVVGGVGREETEPAPDSAGGRLVSFFGFLVILLLR